MCDESSANGNGRDAFRKLEHEKRESASLTHDVHSPAIDIKLYTHAQNALE
jgi:hypothetical protein